MKNQAGFWGDRPGCIRRRPADGIFQPGQVHLLGESPGLSLRFGLSKSTVPQSSPDTANFVARGAHAPSRAAVGALAGRFFSFPYNCITHRPAVVAL